MSQFNPCGQCGTFNSVAANAATAPVIASDSPGEPTVVDAPVTWPLLAAGLLTAAPPLLAYNTAPSPTLINQCLAMGLWGGFVLMAAPGGVSLRAWPLQAALLALLAGVLWSWGPGTLPSAIAWSSLAMLGAAMVLVWTGTQAAQRIDGVGVFVAFAWGLLAAGLLSVGVALVQVFAPGWADGNWIARSGLVGRAVGNLRQPNHLCSLLLWAVIAAVALLELRRLSLKVAVALVVALVFAVELTASRTGAAGLLLLALWGALSGSPGSPTSGPGRSAGGSSSSPVLGSAINGAARTGRGLSRPTRWLLLATPILYAASYGAMFAWGEWTHQAIGAEARLVNEGAGIESPNTRWRIWSNALALIAQQPWTGVGFGEFNLAWSLTPFPSRPTAFFDHTHNLPLQLVVELGIPLAGLVLTLMLVALGLAWQRSRRAIGELSVAAMSAWMMVLMIGVHSQVEYPLWYAYFLLPAAFAWGFALGVPSAGKSGASGATTALRRQPASSNAGMLAGAALLAGAGLAMLDYLRAVAIYAPGNSASTLSERIARGQASPLFAYHGDYAAATSFEPEPGTALALQRAPHYLMDTRLMIAWARHLAANGQVDLARSLADRLREFRNADAAEFLAVCAQPGAPEFQCQKPLAAHGWREYVNLPR